ncbi:uncharacterized protein LOC124288478 [Haliotis rubra]|uniref:uncharacterized protein LOC124288478 n=1 Tax=Haliotis rubra TaxID=36100 RepID=UPI001EE4F28C|nr:uncharacterized protein LOC124288478 [Haliotis rubra]
MVVSRVGTDHTALGNVEVAVFKTRVIGGMATVSASRDGIQNDVVRNVLVVFLDRACDHLNGRCRTGCKPGWTGITCSTNICRNCVNSTCPSGTYGSRCHGCVSGYRGQTCEEKCADNCAVCSQFGNICSECKQGSLCITAPTTFASNTVSTSGDFSINITVTSEVWTSISSIGLSTVVHHSATSWKTFSSSGIRRMSFIFACVLLAFAVCVTAWCARETWRQRKPKTRTGLDTWSFSVDSVPRHSQSGVTQLQEANLYYDGTRLDSRNHDEGRYHDSPVGYESLRYISDNIDVDLQY